MALPYPVPIRQAAIMMTGGKRKSETERKPPSNTDTTTAYSQLPRIKSSATPLTWPRE